jgi:hypothetical protein
MWRLQIGEYNLRAKPRDCLNIDFLYIDDLDLLALARYGKVNIHLTFLSNTPHARVLPGVGGRDPSLGLTCSMSSRADA